jgi:peptidoglycan/xylan/chitin deacetylase (PgdA/CDA1 family)
MDVLALSGVRATFFWLGSRLVGNRKLVQRAVAEGHELGNHSWSHASFAQLSESQLERELRSTDSLIADITGVRPRYVRPPFGIISVEQRAFARERFGYEVVLWNVDTSDWRRPGVDRIAETICAAAGSRQLILLHDLYDDTVNAVELALSRVNAPAWLFDSVTRVRDASDSGAHGQEHGGNVRRDGIRS